MSDMMGISAPVRPVRGELLLVRSNSARFTHDISWRHNGVYHHAEDSFWLGGTLDEAGFDCNPTHIGRDRVLENIAKFFPKIRDLQILRHVAGLRPMTPDGMPIAGRLPGWNNAHITAGGGVKGLLLSCKLGETTARSITEETDYEDYPFLSVERFT
jgi:glycine oxidase